MEFYNARKETAFPGEMFYENHRHFNTNLFSHRRIIVAPRLLFSVYACLKFS
jgi:hypothetical protein